MKCVSLVGRVGTGAPECSRLCCQGPQCRGARNPAGFSSYLSVSKKFAFFFFFFNNNREPNKIAVQARSSLHSLL